MLKTSDIKVVLVRLEVASRQVLFILLAADGTINRMGDGTPTNSDQDLYIGRTPTPLLPKLLTSLTDDMLQFSGLYEVSEKAGETCELSIVFQLADGTKNSFGFIYGLKSQGVPPDIVRFVIRAVALTKPWHESQKAMNSEKDEPAKKP
jgi:hypothetical protein